MRRLSTILTALILHLRGSSDHFVRAFHDTYGMPTIVTNCSNNYGSSPVPQRGFHSLFINNICHRKPPVYGKGENVRDCNVSGDHARVYRYHLPHNGTEIAETYNIGEASQWSGKNIGYHPRPLSTVRSTLGRPEGAETWIWITYVSLNRLGHDARYAIDSNRNFKRNWVGGSQSLQFEEGI